jgi:hypothetical protein
MYLKKVVSKKKFFVGVWKVTLENSKIPGAGSGSVSKSYGSAYLDPYQNVTDPQHCLLHILILQKML